MLHFEKRSFWSMLILNIVTCSFYQFYYLNRTAKQLQKSGIMIPSVFFYYILTTIVAGALAGTMRSLNLPAGFFLDIINLMVMLLPLASFYFWCYYIYAYCSVIKQNSGPEYCGAYIGAWMILRLSTPYIVYWLIKLPFVSIAPSYRYSSLEELIIWLVLYALEVTLQDYFLFQRGFNSYIKQSKRDNSYV